MDTSSWQNSEDVLRDLYEYSNLDYPGGTFAPAPPKSIAEYRARTTRTKNPGLFDNAGEDIEVFISGRGKYQPDRIIRPGIPIVAVPEDDYIIQKKIREVSGLGYSNELIERAYGAKKDLEDEYQEPTVTTPDIKLLPQNEVSNNRSFDSPTRRTPDIKLFPQNEMLSTSSCDSPQSFNEGKVQSDQSGPKTCLDKKKTKKKKFNRWCPDTVAPAPQKSSCSWEPIPNGGRSTLLGYFPPLK